MRQISVTAPWQPNKYFCASFVPNNLTCCFPQFHLLQEVFIVLQCHEGRQGRQIALICVEADFDGNDLMSACRLISHQYVCVLTV